MGLTTFFPGSHGGTSWPSGWGRVWVWLSMLSVPTTALPILWDQGLNVKAMEISLILWMVAASSCLASVLLLRGYLSSVIWLAEGFTKKEIVEIRRWLMPILKWTILLSLLVGSTYWFQDQASWCLMHLGKGYSPCDLPPSLDTWIKRV